MYIDKVDGSVGRIINAAFPGYRGKKVQVKVVEHPINTRSYWDGGSRDYFTFVNLATYESMAVPAQSAFDPKIQGADAVRLPAGFVCVRHSIFCGKDTGITIMVHPDNAPLLLPAPGVELTADQKLVLLYTRGRKSSYMGKDRCQMAQEDMEYAHRCDASKPEPITRERWEAAKASLVTSGHLNKAGAITVTGKNAIDGMRLI